jgi:sec-independent protein translocase protein TatB
MFNLDWSELLIIAVIAVLVVGPKELPGMLRTMGRYAGKMRKVAGEFRAQFDQAMREAELDGLQDAMRETKSALSQVNPVGELRKAVNEAEKSVKDVPKAIDTKPIEEKPGPAAVNGAANGAAPSATDTESQAARETDDPDKRSVAQRAAEAWKKASSEESGA